MLLPVLAKRLLSFALALVLLLSLCPVLPLTADAAVDLTGWEFHNTYKQYFTTAQFISNDTDLVFAENQDYDWYIKFGHNYGSNISLSVEATITDSSGASAGSYSIPATTLMSGTVYSICKVKDFTNFDRTMPGTYTLVVTFYSGTTGVARLTKEFTREGVDNNADFTESSRSKPNKLFTFADPIDLVLNIKKKNGIEEAFNAVTTITNANGETVVGPSNYPIPSSSNTTVSVKDLVDVTNIKTPGNYNVNVALNNDSGKERYSYSFPFAVVNVTRTISITISAADTYEDTDPTPVVKLRKPDGVTEYGSVTITVVNTETNKPVFSQTFEGDIPGDANGKSIYPKMLNFPLVGQFRMDVVAKDSDGITRGTDYKNFTRISSTPLTANLTDHITGSDKAGMIFSDADSPLVLTINHPSSANKMLQIRYTGTYNGEPLNDTREFTMPANGTITLNTADFVKYGIYENLQFSIHTADGTEKWKSADEYAPFSFSFVIDNTNSASLSLLNINDHFTGNINGDYTVKLPLAAQTGADMWRASIPWVSVEPSRNYYRMPESVTNVLDRTQELGMKVLIILAYNNDNILKDANGKDILDDSGKEQKLYGEADPDNPEWLAAYANYCEYIARYMATEKNGKYKDMVVGFEIWNEWNHATMSKVPDKYDRTGDKYAEVVKAASNAIRAVNDTYETSFKVVAGATAGDGYAQGTNTDKFLDAMFQVENIVDYMDVFSFHTYPNPEVGTSSGDNPRYFEFVSPGEFSYENRVKSVKARLDTAKPGHDVEIWMTETGWSTIDTEYDDYDPAEVQITYGVTEKEAAAYMTQMYAWALADGTLDRIFWYDLMNDLKKLPGTNYYDWYDDRSECNWGLIHNCDNDGSDPLAYSAKQGYVAMCALNSKLTGATNGQKVNLGSGIHAHQFEKDGHYLMVVWTDDEADTTRTATLSGSIVITDMFGNATTHSNSATLELSECPIYLEYAKGSHPSIG